MRELQTQTRICTNPAKGFLQVRPRVPELRAGKGHWQHVAGLRVLGTRCAGVNQEPQIDLFGQPVMPADLKPRGRKRMSPYSAMAGTFGACTLEGATCKTCAHLAYNEMRSGKRFYKCGLVKMTSGPGTDIRLSWKACQFYEQEKED